MYSSHGFLRGSYGSSDKALGYGLDDQSSIPGIGGVEILSLLRIQTAPGVHSAYYKMSVGGKAAEQRTSHLTFSSAVAVYTYCIYIPHGPS